MYADIIEQQHIALIGLIAVVVILLFGVAALFVRLSESKLVVNCSSFSSYGAALKALPDYPDLDWNHNGIPCEKLYNHGN